MRGHFREWSVTGALGLLLLALAFFAPSFFQPQPLLSLSASEAPTLIISLGMALVIICREIDISVGSLFSVCSVCAGLLAANHWPLGLAMLSGLVVGGALGAVNGALVAGLGLPSIVVTLATMVTWREGLNWWRQGQFVYLPDRLQWFGLRQAVGQWAVVGAALVLLGALALGVRHLAAGRFLSAAGSDAEAARLAGIRPMRVKFWAFAGMGVLTGLAAVLNVVQSPQVDPKDGTGLELKTIAAVVVGGVAITGGRGSLWGTFSGVLLLACISPALIHMHVAAFWEKAVQGAIILLSVVADGVRSRRGRR